MGDEATIDDELLVIRAVEDMDAMHIRLLARLAQPTTHPGWTVTDITQADPGLFDAVYALLETLQLHNLAWEQQPEGFYRGPGGVKASYQITNAGRLFLDRLADEADQSQR